MINSERAYLIRSIPNVQLFSPLFVTWNTLHGHEWRLRGCIGNFEAMPIQEGIAEYALISAFGDTRFKKIVKSELENLQCR